MHIKRIEFDHGSEPLDTPQDAGGVWFPVALLVVLLAFLALAMWQGVSLPPQPAESWTGAEAGPSCPVDLATLERCGCQACTGID